MSDLGCDLDVIRDGTAKAVSIADAFPLEVTLRHDCVFIEEVGAEQIKNFIGAEDADLGSQLVGVVRGVGTSVTKVKVDQAVLFDGCVPVAAVSAAATEGRQWMAMKESCIQWVIDARPLDWSAENRDVEEMEV